MRRILFLALITLFAFNFKASAQQFVLSGRITDQQNNPIPFVAVYIKNSTYGTTSNADGVYQFKLTAGTYAIVYRYVGYQERVEKVTITNHNEERNVRMEDEVFKLRDVAIKGKVADDTAANNIMHKVIARRKFYLNEVKSYSSVVYIKGMQRLTSAPKSLLREGVSKKLDLDTNGRGIINQSESLSTLSFGLPHKVKEVTIASRTAGIDPTFSYSRAADLPTNFYENIFTVNGLSSRGFVSPVASNAFAYYRFRLLGTTVENGRIIDKIELTARHSYARVFSGNIYIVEGDWRIYSVDLYLTQAHNHLNLVDTMAISQQYIPVKDTIWKPASVQYNYKGNVFGFKFDGYYIGIYNNYKFNIDTVPHYFNGEVLKIDSAANLKKEDYWVKNRPVPLTQAEARYFHKKDSVSLINLTPAYLDSLQRSKNSLLIIPYTVFGYNYTSRDNKDSLYVYPFLQTLFYNTVEGYGINLKVRHTKVFDDYRSLSISPAVRYSFGDNQFNANLHIKYNFDPFNSGNLFGGFGTDVLDLSNVGTRSLYFNTLSTLLSNNNYVKYYHTQFGDIGYQHEIANGVLWTSSLSYANRTQMFNNSYNHIFVSKTRQYTSNNPLAPDAPADDRSPLFPQNQALTFSTSFKFTFSQQYITRATGKVYLPSPYPVVTVNYRKAIPGAFGSDADYDFASVDVSQDNITLGLFGHSSFKLTAGTFLNSRVLYFMDYNHFLGNQGTTFDPTYVGSFHFLPFYTYSANSAFVEAHVQHNFSGVLLNKIPFMRRFKLEEIIGANYLTEKNNPNYSEFYVGLQRLIFRVDYGVSYAGNKKYIQGFRIYYGLR